MFTAAGSFAPVNVNVIMMVINFVTHTELLDFISDEIHLNMMTAENM